MRRVLLLSCCASFGSFAGADAAEAQIANIHRFLETCPTEDPAYWQFRRDFDIRRNGRRVGVISCRTPVSTVPLDSWTDELILLQGLRVIYYMDRGRSHHLPWTAHTMYDWVRSRIRGFDITDTLAADVAAACCGRLGGAYYVRLKPQDGFNRDFDRTWVGIAGNIGLYGHEVRHRDGHGYQHDSSCGRTRGCDAAYDEVDPGGYGVAWWLNARFLSGDLYVGASCGSEAQTRATADRHLTANTVLRRVFSSRAPAPLDLPEQPGGICRTATAIQTPRAAQEPGPSW